MKAKLFFASLALVCCASLVNAQDGDYKKFRVVLGLGYAKPGGEGAGGGVLFTMEPSYRIKDEIALGLRMEWAVIARGFDGGNSVDVSASALGSYTLNGQYYFTPDGFRPFVGAGFGLYSLGSVSTGTSGTGAVAAESKVGFYPRLGFEAGHFNLTIDFNIIPATKVDDLSGSGSEITIKNSYFGIRAGAFIGGGKR